MPGCVGEMRPAADPPAVRTRAAPPASGQRDQFAVAKLAEFEARLLPRRLPAERTATIVPPSGVNTG